MPAILLTLALLLPQTAPPPLTALTAPALTHLTDTLPTAPLADLPTLIPTLVQSAADPDPHLRSLALFALITLTNRTRPDGSLSSDALPLLEPFLPLIAQHLHDPDPAVRQLTALFLGGFLTHPTPAVLAPLLEALAAPDPPTPFHLSVIVALLTLGPDAHPEIAPAILHFLLRPDLPPDLTPRLLGAIASHPRHSPLLDTGLLALLDPSRPPTIRAALIAALPYLALTPSALETTRATLTRILATPSEDPAVKAQAAAILPCWHAPRMSDPCPAPTVQYRMLPSPPRPAVTPPRYRSPILP